MKCKIQLNHVRLNRTQPVLCKMLESPESLPIRTPDPETQIPTHLHPDPYPSSPDHYKSPHQISTHLHTRSLPIFTPNPYPSPPQILPISTQDPHPSPHQTPTHFHPGSRDTDPYPSPPKIPTYLHHRSIPISTQDLYPYPPQILTDLHARSLPISTTDPYPDPPQIPTHLHPRFIPNNQN